MPYDHPPGRPRVSAGAAIADLVAGVLALAVLVFFLLLVAAFSGMS